MAGDAVAKIPRPSQMRGFTTSFFMRTLIGATVSSFAAAVAFKIFVADARKARYAEFYRTYDADAHFEDMRKKGLFDSC